MAAKISSKSKGLIAVGILLALAAFWQLAPGGNPKSEETALPPRPSAELAPFEWHEEPVALPDLTFTSADGDVTNLADLSGQFVLINLWATWCAPCLREMPMLDALAAAARGPGLKVIALNQDRAGLEAALPYWQDKGFSALDMYLDEGLATGRALKPTGLPLTVLIDPEGREIARLAGIASWDDPEVIDYFKAVAAAGG